MGRQPRAAASSACPTAHRSASASADRVVPDAAFRELPRPVGQPPYRRRLDELIGHEAAAEIARAGVFRFHAVGDTGGHRDPRPQARVAAAMTCELSEPAPPRFFYHLGDVVYPHGEESHYHPQFFSAYGEYTAPIVGVPGNHDAESPDAELTPFVRTFCSTAPPLHDAAARIPRRMAQQPHVHWTLESRVAVDHRSLQQRARGRAVRG